MTQLQIANPHRLHLQSVYDELFCGKKCKNKREREEIENQRLQAQVEDEKKRQQMEQELLQNQTELARSQKEYQDRLQQIQLESEKELQTIVTQSQHAKIEDQQFQKAETSSLTKKVVTYLSIAIGIVLIVLAIKKFR